MIEGLVQLGSALLRDELSLENFIEPLKTKGKEKQLNVFKLNFDLENRQLIFDLNEETDDDTAYKYNHIGSGSSRAAQWYASSQSINYFISETVLNLSRLDLGEKLNEEIKEVLSEFFVNFEGFGRKYSHLLDLSKYGISEKTMEEIYEESKDEDNIGKKMLNNMGKEINNYLKENYSQTLESFGIFVLQINGHTIANDKNYIERVFESKRPREKKDKGICSLCGTDTELTWDLTRTKIKLFTTNLSIFSSNFNKKDYSRNMQLCESCLMKLMAGENYTMRYLDTRLAGFPVYIVPQFIYGGGCQMKYYSHPGRLLVDHLREVNKIGVGKLPGDMREAYKIVSMCHDFGKYTSYFQDYLARKKKNDYSNHGFISAVFGAFVAMKKYGEESNLPLLIYNVILHHHGNIDNPSTNLPNTFINPKKIDYEINLSRKIEIYGVQLQDIISNKEYMEDDMSILGLKEDFAEFIRDENLIFEILSKLKKIEYIATKKKDYNNYFLHQLLYSTLISSDKLSASGIKYDGPLFVEFANLNEIKNRRFGKAETEIDSVRNEIFKKVQLMLDKKGRASNIFYITAPTGTGKTLTGFFAALKLRELLNLEGKIIYALPFTSIIEQNYDTIKKIYEEVKGYNDNRSRYVIKHHNLSKTEYESEYRDYTKTQSELLIENWESGVIVTTFVQLFETIVGNRNRMLKKYINFYNSIIILDEIQSVDIKYHKLIEFVLEKLCEVTNSKIIMMTATKPMILTQGIELLENNDRYYSLFNRTALKPKLENISIDEFVEDFAETIENKSYLIVCNTINQSLEVYDKIKELGRESYYLSTNILPIHRKGRIKLIEDKLKAGEKIIVVSTQVVEAGVDLDFDEVIRDIGPLDSIIQCAGRCNRHGHKDMGNVRIYKMVKENGFNYGNSIYGSTLINITLELLKDKEEIKENDYYNLIEEYFEEVKINKSSQVSEELIKSIKILDYSKGDNAINKFSLIENNPMYHDILFLYDHIAEEAFEEYREIVKINDFEKKRERYLEIGQTLKGYTLTVPDTYIKSFTEELGILILPNSGINDFYDIDTGFKRDKDDETMIF